VLKTIQARLRFIVILVAIGVVIGNWSTITNYYEKWTRASGQETVAGSGFEYFCPMHLQIVRDKPNEKCPICHMDLAKRKKGTGDVEPLPAGIVNRVQLSPYRVVLAGVRTSEAQRLALEKEITAFGSVEFNETKQAHIAAIKKGRIVKLFVNYTGQMVEKGEKLALLDVRYSPELAVTLRDLVKARLDGNNEREQMARRRLRNWDFSDPEIAALLTDTQLKEFKRTDKVNTEIPIFSPIKGHVIKKYQREGSFVEEGTPLYDVDDLETVWIEAQVYEADQALLKKDQMVTATTEAFPNRAFQGKLDFVYPHLDESSRTLTVRFHMPNRGHWLRPGMYVTVTLKVPPAEMGGYSRALAEEAARNNGRVLAVPDSAVIDTGKLKIVYRETTPYVFEGVEVQLGPRMAAPGSTLAYYPVLKGLQAGDRVVVNGGFLIDAETRLNAAAGSIYFGGSGSKTSSSSVTVRPSTPLDEDASTMQALAEVAKLPAADRSLAAAQRLCPITKEPLGSKGVPVKLDVLGQAVFLCCGGCKKKALADSAGTLRKVKELNTRGATSRHD
jgi:RND family efflux transporter MFP subunit